MKKQDILSIMITFVVGFMAGGYLYVVGLAGWVANIGVPTEERASSFVVVGDLYGGCRDNCPSFQLLGNGSYRYVYVQVAGEGRKLIEGALPLKQQRALAIAMTEKNLVSQSEPVTVETCNSHVDKMDVKYEITIEGTKYNLDSCKTAYDGASSLWQTLNGVWGYLEEQRNIQE